MNRHRNPMWPFPREVWLVVGFIGWVVVATVILWKIVEWIF